jgi:hypothetical protein
MSVFNEIRGNETKSYQYQTIVGSQFLASLSTEPSALNLGKGEVSQDCET